MTDLMVINSSQQDLAVVLCVEGERRTVAVRKRARRLFVNTEVTPELEALIKSKLSVVYKVLEDE